MRFYARFKVRKCEGVRGEISSENQTEIDFRFERKCMDDRGEENFVPSCWLRSRFSRHYVLETRSLGKETKRIYIRAENKRSRLTIGYFVNRETNKAINRLNSASTQFSNRIFPSSPPSSLSFFLISYRTRKLSINFNVSKFTRYEIFW